jgi:ABC-type transporter Mla subunit MlaD
MKNRKNRIQVLISAVLVGGVLAFMVAAFIQDWKDTKELSACREARK